MTDLRMMTRGPLSPPDTLNVRIRPPDIPSPPGYRPGSRAMGVQLPEPLQLSSRPLPSLEDEDHEPLRISFHEDEMRSQTLSRPSSGISFYDLSAELRISVEADLRFLEQESVVQPRPVQAELLQSHHQGETVRAEALGDKEISTDP